MAVEERDRHTGYMTTGHEWNGITELNRPVPKVIWLFLGATVVFSIVYWILMPAWPMFDTYNRGILRLTQQTRLAEDLRQTAADRSAWTRQIEMLRFADIQADESLMKVVRETGRPLFEDNCGACHGMQGLGGHGFPRLTDSTWLWGGDPETVAETIRVGINSMHDETRLAQMPPFGRDGILDRKAILDVVSYVHLLSGAEPVSGDQSDSAIAGADVFAANCAACHGESGTGITDMGAPDLTDGFWIYGGDRASVYTTVYRGRQGHMPHWDGRVSALERKILTLYVLDLGAAER